MRRDYSCLCTGMQTTHALLPAFTPCLPLTLAPFNTPLPPAPAVVNAAVEMVRVGDVSYPAEYYAFVGYWVRGMGWTPRAGAPKLGVA